MWAGNSEESFTTITTTFWDDWNSRTDTETFTSTSLLAPSYSEYRGPSIGSGSSFAQTCNAASQVWSAVYESLTATITTSVVPTYSYITNYPPGPHPTFTLCDHYPRAHGSPNVTRVLANATYTTVVTITTVSPNPAQPPPACSINSADCEQLWSSYELDGNFILDTLTITGALQLSIWGSPEKYSYWSIAGSDFIAPRTPACPSSDLTTLTSTCNEEAQYYLGDAASENSCLIYSGPVRLLYFPPTDDGNEFCHVNATTNFIQPTGTPGIPETVEQFGTTFTSGTAYLSFETLYAKNRCGQTVGTPISNYFYPLPSSEVTTECAGSLPKNGITSNYITAVEQPMGPINYNYLNGPVPASVYKCMPNCNGGLPGWETLCPTIWDNYNPVLAFPTGLLNLQEAWPASNCYFDTFSLFELEGGGNLLFDPPYLLTPVNAPAVLTPTTGLMDPTSTTTPAPAPYSSQPQKGTSTHPPPTPPPAPLHSSQRTSPTVAPDPSPKAPSGGPSRPSPTPVDPPGDPQDPSQGSWPAGDPAPQQGDPAGSKGSGNPTSPQSPHPGTGGNFDHGEAPGPDPAPDPRPVDPSNIGGDLASIIAQPPPHSDPSNSDPNPASGNEDDPGRLPIVVGGSDSGSSGSGEPHSGSNADPGNIVSLLNSPSKVSNGKPPPAPLATIGSHTVQAGDPANPGVIIDGSSLSAGETTVIAGTPVSVGAHSLIMGSATTIPRASVLAHPNDPVTTIANIPIRPDPAGAPGFLVGSRTLSPGASMTVGGTLLSVASDGALVISSTTALALPAGSADSPDHASGDADRGPEGASAVFTFDGKSYTAHVGSPLVVDGATLMPGGPAVTVADGEVLSLASNGVVVDGSRTFAFSGDGGATAIAADVATGVRGEAVITLGGHVYTALEEGGGDVLLGLMTLTPGEVTTVDGQRLSIGTGGELVVGSATEEFTVAFTSADPGAMSEAVVTLDGHAVTAVEEGLEAVLGGSMTLSWGEVTTIDGETVSFGAGGLVVDGRTVSMTAMSGTKAGTASPATPTVSGASSGIGNGGITSAASTGAQGTDGPGSSAKRNMKSGHQWRWTLLVLMVAWAVVLDLSS
ncbi:MAG: hypothetical protein Q9157_000381 [Trypethelium eluteriae]